MRLAVPGPNLARWRLRAHWEAMQARAHVEALLRRPLTAAEFSAFCRPIIAVHRKRAA